MQNPPDERVNAVALGKAFPTKSAIHQQSNEAYLGKFQTKTSARLCKWNLLRYGLPLQSIHKISAGMAATINCPEIIQEKWPQVEFERSVTPERWWPITEVPTVSWQRLPEVGI